MDQRFIDLLKDFFYQNPSATRVQAINAIMEKQIMQDKSQKDSGLMKNILRGEVNNKKAA